MTAALNVDKLCTFNKAPGKDQALFRQSDTNVNNPKCKWCKTMWLFSFTRTVYIYFGFG